MSEVKMTVKNGSEQTIITIRDNCILLEAKEINFNLKGKGEAK